MAKIKNRMEKRRKKDANQAQYEAWRDAGQNSKSRRARSTSRKANVSNTKHRHIVFDCGNIGCRACSPFGWHLEGGRRVFVTNR